MEKPYREAGGPTEGIVNLEANRGANPGVLRAVSSVCTLETANSALWRGYYLKYIILYCCNLELLLQLYRVLEYSST